VTATPPSPQVASVTRETRSGALSGAFIWGVLVLATVGGRTPLGTIELLLLLAPLVLVPLGLEVARGASISPLGRWVRLLLPIGGVLATASFFVPMGHISALLSIGWTIVCALAAVDAVMRFARGAYRSAEGICANAAFIYLFVGSLWLHVSRHGSTPFNYSALTVLLAAVHFHFTGFALPMVASATARARRARLGSAGALFPFVTAGILAGPALLAAGNIRHSPVLKTAGALLLVVVSFALAGLIGCELRGISSKAVRALLALSGALLVLGMTLVAIYAVGELSAQDWLTVPTMARLHGTLNALGFSLCGLLGWTLGGAAAQARQVN